jgi:hypothetical protein
MIHAHGAGSLGASRAFSPQPRDGLALVGKRLPTLALAANKAARERRVSVGVQTEKQIVEVVCVLER